MVFRVFQLSFKVGNPVSGIRLLLLWLFLQEFVLHLQLADIIVQSGIVLDQLIVPQSLWLKLCLCLLQFLSCLLQLELRCLLSWLECLARGRQFSLQGQDLLIFCLKGLFELLLFHPWVCQVFFSWCQISLCLLQLVFSHFQLTLKLNYSWTLLLIFIFHFLVKLFVVLNLGIVLFGQLCEVDFLGLNCFLELFLQMRLVIWEELELPGQFSELLFVNLELLELRFHRFTRLGQNLLIIFNFAGMEFGLFRFGVEFLDLIIKSGFLVFNFNSLILFIIDFLIQQSSLVL